MIEKASEKSAARMIEEKRKELSLIGIERKQIRNRSIEVRKTVSCAPSAYYELVDELVDEKNSGTGGEFE